MAQRMPLEVKVRRAAGMMNSGPEILRVVEGSVDQLVAEAGTGSPPVGAIARKLARQFPTEMKLAPYRQFVGSAVKAVLARAGWEIAQTGVRLPKGSVFRTGSTYRKAERGGAAEAGFEETWERIVRALTSSEQRLLAKVVRRVVGEV